MVDSWDIFEGSWWGVGGGVRGSLDPFKEVASPALLTSGALMLSHLKTLSCSPQNFENFWEV